MSFMANDVENLFCILNSVVIASLLTVNMFLNNFKVKLFALVVNYKNYLSTQIISKYAKNCY